jgi:hypothetical protein
VRDACSCIPADSTRPSDNLHSLIFDGRRKCPIVNNKRYT